MSNDFYQKKEPSTEAGLTLLEIIVALAIFTIVAFVMSSALVSVVGESQRSRSSQQAVNNLNVTVSDMVRSLRTGFYYTCGGGNPYNASRDGTGSVNCLGGESEIAFIAQDRSWVEYSLDEAENKILKTEYQADDSGGFLPATTFPITAPNISIDKLSFRVAGADRGEEEQSKALITVSGTAGDQNATSSFNIQTSATQRLLYP